MISVCIATYNGEQFIEEQLKSILIQLSDEDEVIISDDGSFDSTLSIVSKLKDNRIRIIKNTRRPSKSVYNFFYTTVNFENALSHAKGDYIFISDQDDLWKGNRIKEIVTLLNDNLLVINDCTVVDQELNPIALSYFELCAARKGILKNLIKNSYLGCCMAFRKDLMKNILPFPNVPIPHDIWIGLIAETTGDVCFLKSPLVYYRRHGKNLSPSSETSSNSFFYKVSYRTLLIFSLIVRILKIQISR